jgi:hypothetical protein
MTFTVDVKDLSRPQSNRKGCQNLRGIDPEGAGRSAWMHGT